MLFVQAVAGGRVLTDSVCRDMLVPPTQPWRVASESVVYVCVCWLGPRFVSVSDVRCMFERNRNLGSTGVLTPYTQRVNIPQRVNAPPGKSTPLSVSTRLQACQHAEACQRASRRVNTPRRVSAPPGVSTRRGVSARLQASFNTPRRVNAPPGESTRLCVSTRRQACQHAEACQRTWRRVNTSTCQHAEAC